MQLVVLLTRARQKRHEICADVRISPAYVACLRSHSAVTQVPLQYQLACLHFKDRREQHVISIS